MCPQTFIWKSLTYIGIGMLVGMFVCEVLSYTHVYQEKPIPTPIVAVPITEKDVTCFIDSEAHGISCLPNWLIHGEIPK